LHLRGAGEACYTNIKKLRATSFTLATPKKWREGLQLRGAGEACEEDSTKSGTSPEQT